MPRYLALAKVWISHEARLIQADEEFETEFPKVNGKPMALGDNIKLVKTKDDAKKSEAPIV